MTASQPRTGPTWTSWPSARASVRVQAPAHSRIVAASNVPSSVATRPRVTRFTSTWVRTVAPAARAAVAAAAVSAPGSVRKPSG